MKYREVCYICNALVMDAPDAVGGVSVAHVHDGQAARTAGLVSPGDGYYRFS